MENERRPRERKKEERYEKWDSKEEDQKADKGSYRKIKKMEVEAKIEVNKKN